MYWVYRTHILTWRNQYVQAKLIDPPVRELRTRYGRFGFRSALQDEPYGVDLDLTFQVDPRHPHPDHYFQSARFTLCSGRLVTLLRTFDVQGEFFKVRMVDKAGQPLPDLDYYVFHSFEGMLDAMDAEASEWTGDRDVGVPRLVLNSAGFPLRPMFVCVGVLVDLMRDDLVAAFRGAGMTGWAFLPPERYRSGRYGMPPPFEP